MKCPLNFSFLPENSEEKFLDSHTLNEIEAHLILDSSSCPHPPIKELVLTGASMVDGSTPLLLACEQGKLDSVKHIIESWGVDVQTAATYRFCHYEEPLYNVPISIVSVQATPLFVAAYNGHLDIVQYLVGKGADVAAKTSSQAEPLYDELTPLDGVFIMFDPSISMISFLLDSGSPLPSNSTGNPFWMKPFFDPEILNLLINHGMSVNSRHSNGTSILHHWASLPEEDSLTIVKLLVGKGADLMARNGEGFTPILLAANALCQEEMDFSVFDFLLERDCIDRCEKIDALELAGAVILSCHYQNSIYNGENTAESEAKAFGYWRRALQLRLLDTNGYQPIVKNPLKLKSGQTFEWVTSDQLEQVIQHPKELKIKFQSFLIRLRIASTERAGTNAFPSSFAPFIRCFLTDCENDYEGSRFQELLNATFAIFETVLADPSRRYSWYSLVTIDNGYFWNLSSIEKNAPQLYTLKTAKESLKFMVETDGYHLGSSSAYMTTLFNLVKMMTGHTALVEDDDIKDYLFQLLSRDRRDRDGRRLLHHAFIDRDKHTDLYSIVRLLLVSNADPNAADRSGSAALHFLAEFTNKEEFESIGRLLMDHGAHLDQVNGSRKTALDIWTERHYGKRHFEMDRGAPEWKELPDWCRQFPKLKCLCSRIVRLSGIPHSDVEEIPADVSEFIEWH